MLKRKICVIVASRANYGRVKSVLHAINNHPNLELQLIVSASALLYRFGKIIDAIRNDGFTPIQTLHYIVEGENLVTQAKSTGLGIIELSTSFEMLEPDIVVTVADRFETLATAIAASYLNIPLAHIQGGEISGNIDDSVRHAITRLAHIHFPATQKSTERILRMGEEPWRVHCTGCPSIDLIVDRDITLSEKIFNRNGGIGHPIDLSQPYILMVQHPVTTSFGEGLAQIQETLSALKSRPEQKIIIWPNIDAGSDDVSKGIRMFREKNLNEKFFYTRGFSPEDYVCVLKNAVCAVGNSSSFIREGAYLGVPVINIGDRQKGREHGDNIIFSDYSADDIGKKIVYQITHGRYPQSKIFGEGNAGKRIADVLATTDLNIEKRLTY